MFWLLFNKISSHLGALEQVTKIVLKGYSNGNTYVYDPYNAANNGWYPIEWLWREQSTQSGDINGLGNSFVKVTNI